MCGVGPLGIETIISLLLSLAALEKAAYYQLKQSPRGDSDPRPRHYECRALPAELRGHIKSRPSTVCHKY